MTSLLGRCSFVLSPMETVEVGEFERGTSSVLLTVNDNFFVVCKWFPHLANCGGPGSNAGIEHVFGGERQCLPPHSQKHVAVSRSLVPKDLQNTQKSKHMTFPEFIRPR